MKRGAQPFGSFSQGLQASVSFVDSVG